MGVFDLFKKKKENSKQFAQMLNGYLPIFSQFGNNIYASDVVQQAINCIVREMKKCEPKHVKKNEKGHLLPQHDNIQNILTNPNPLMTTSDFIEKVVWNLYLYYNSFIIPTYDKYSGKLDGLYPIQPNTVEFLQDNSGEYFVKFKFVNQYEGTIRYKDVIHIRYNFSVSEFMGGDEAGQPNYAALLKTLELNNTLLEGVSKALKSSFAINGVIKYNTLLDRDKTEKALNELTDALRNNASGFMPLDLKGEFIPFNRQIQMVDETTLRFIDEKILRHFGVPLHILTGAYNKSEYEAFYQKTIEPLVVSLSQAFTKTLFTNRESSSFGHEIIFYTDKANFMSTAEKITYYTLLSNVGAITPNEIRAGMGMPPVEDEKVGNALVMSKNFGDAASVKDADKNKQNNTPTGTNNNDDNGGDENGNE